MLDAMQVIPSKRSLKDFMAITSGDEVIVGCPSGTLAVSETSVPKEFSWWNEKMPDGRHYISHVEDQGQTPSCVGFAFTNNLELLKAIRHGIKINLSAWDAYAWASLHDLLGNDLKTGTYPRTVLAGLKQRGCALERTIPHQSKIPKETPELNQERNKHRIDLFAKIDKKDWSAIKAITHKNGCCMVVPTGWNWDRESRIDKLENSRGLHAIHAIGFDRTYGNEWVEFEDSHGYQAHDQGRVWLTRDYIADHAREIWMQLDALTMPEVPRNQWFWDAMKKLNEWMQRDD